MGERQSDDGPAGRRRVHPEGGPSGRDHAVDTAGLEALLAAALVPDSVDAAAEQRAVAAFRAARETGAHHARTRRRDDWRSRRRLGSNSVKAVLSVLLGGLALGGVAVAGIGTGPAADGPARDDGRTHASSGPSTGESAGAGSASAGPGSASAGPDRPAGARDAEVHCRAYERVGGRGRALEATAWKWLTEAAGGEAKVAAYCAERLERAAAEARPGGPPAPGENAGETARAGNGSSGDARDAAGSGPADAGNDAGGAGAGGSGAGGSGTGVPGAVDGGSGSRQGKPAQPGADAP
ncbi:hypothetical protein GCM10019016_070630 [Streptomyces prasinosporus]|uniref:Uncharacterized protein n=1 Tax=Streptomyces prasinosporus TaxID=68256 RepID=A0ABP6TZ19_9ACTN